MEQRRNIGLLRVDKNRNTNSCFLGLCFLNKLKNIVTTLNITTYGSDISVIIVCAIKK